MKPTKKIICESGGCPQVAEYKDPMGNNLCSDCVQSEVETGEYSWDECEAIDNLWSRRS